MPHFHEFELGEQILDQATCPRDCYALVPPLQPPGKVFQDKFDRSMGEGHPFLGKAGWSICWITYHRARSDHYQQEIIAVKATELGTLEQFAKNPRSVKLTPSNLNTFQFVLDEKTNLVKLGPKGFIMVDGPLRGRGLGSFLISDLIAWAKAIGWGDAEVARGFLSSNHDSDDDNFERRDRLYRGTGLDIEYGPDGKSGQFSKKLLGDLKSHQERARAPSLPPVHKLSNAEAGIALAQFSIRVPQYQEIEDRRSELLQDGHFDRARHIRRVIGWSVLAGVIITLGITHGLSRI